MEILVVHAEQIEKKNICEEAIHKNTIFKVTGVYGNSIETEWSPAAAYILLKEMKKLLVLKKEFVEKYYQWRFEFAEMIGGKTIVFVFHEKIFKAFCGGSNSFFVEKK